MITLGIILLIIGFIASVPILWTIGIILLVVGLVLYARALLRQDKLSLPITMAELKAERGHLVRKAELIRRRPNSGDDIGRLSRPDKR